MLEIPPTFISVVARLAIADMRPISGQTAETARLPAAGGGVGLD